MITPLRPSRTAADTRIEVTTTADATVVCVHGEVDLSITDRLAAQLEIETDLRPRALLVDFDDVTFCSARGFATLLEACAHAHESGVPFAAVSAQRTVLRPFHQLSLGRVLHLLPTHEDATRWLKEV
ncbi:hypothetical protein GCM10022222_53450 [Amycolatopsis ultiminotia]|uniref:STAS domain-containing protein n=1 Tax=Amycolatopsis ultiminotia TaxID=543629 RepID=A0ABP6XAE0_9PSEU